MGGCSGSGVKIDVQMGVLFGQIVLIKTILHTRESTELLVPSLTARHMLKSIIKMLGPDNHITT